MNITISYIKQLKLLPKHGKSIDEDGVENQIAKNRESYLETLAKKSKSLETSFKDLAPGLDEIISLSLKLNNETIQTSLSFAGQVNQLRKNKKALIDLSKAITFAEQRNKEIQKSFGLNTEQAFKLGKTYDKLATSYKVSGEATRKYGMDLNKILPGLQKTVAGSGELGSSLVKLQNAFQQNLGLSGETANNFIRFAGGSEDALLSTLNTAKALEKVTGLQGLNRDLTRDLSNLAPQIQLQFSKIPGSLELAVLKARTLGMSFSDIAATGEKLLDVESSVNDELEYQLLSGKRLVDENGKSLTQQFRQAAITGDANAQADAMNKILETQGDTIENNVFARKQLAKTLGIEESKLSAMVQQRKMLKKLGPEAEALLEMSGSELAAAIDDFKAKNAEQAADLDKALEPIDTRTTDERLLQVLSSIEAKLGGDQTIQTTQSASAQVSNILPGDFAKAGVDQVKKIEKSIGPLVTTFQILKPALTDLHGSIPIFGDAVNSFTSGIENLTSGFSKLTTPMTPSEAGTEKNIQSGINQNDDAIVRVNDAILFNPNDKFNIVASTSPGALDQATADITGAGKGSSSGPSAQEIGAAVANALQGVNLYVSPNELAAEMAFNSYNINA